ncbi:MAG: hypothetical protein ACE5EX_04985 [Phycisphaerae bacterium]
MWRPTTTLPGISFVDLNESHSPGRVSIRFRPKTRKHLGPEPLSGRRGAPIGHLPTAPRRPLIGPATEAGLT